jgi:hypothetical protein
VTLRNADNANPTIVKHGLPCSRDECIAGGINELDEFENRATSDLFTEVVRTPDKDLYFLESHLHG